MVNNRSINHYKEIRDIFTLREVNKEVVEPFVEDDDTLESELEGGKD